MSNYLMDKEQESYSYLKKVSLDSHLYNGFNLLTAEFRWVKAGGRFAGMKAAASAAGAAAAAVLCLAICALFLTGCSYDSLRKKQVDVISRRERKQSPPALLCSQRPGRNPALSRGRHKITPSSQSARPRTLWFCSGNNLQSSAELDVLSGGFLPFFPP